MFRALVVAKTPKVADGLSRSLLGSGRFGPVRSADLSQSPQKLDQVLRFNAPDVVFFEAGDNLDVEAHGHRLSELQPGLPIVAFGSAASWDYLLHLIRAGFCEYLPTPIHEREVIEFAQRLERLVRVRPVSQGSGAQLVSFLPAKPGAGASTVAINTSGVLAQQFHSRTLLVDLDFSAGIVAFALDLKPAFSILHALEHLSDLDHELWAKIVIEKGNLHVVPAPDTPVIQADLSHLMEIIHLGRRFHDIVCVDLSGMLEEFTLGVMEESKHIFVVCSLETPVLHLARRRIARLTQLGFRDRLSVIVNRWNTCSGITLEQVSEMLGRPVFATVYNDYMELQKAFNKGVMVDPSSRLGRDFTSLAARIGGHSIPAETAPRGLRDRLSHWLFPSKREILAPEASEATAPIPDLRCAARVPPAVEAVPAPLPPNGVELEHSREPSRTPPRTSRKALEPLSDDDVKKLIALCEEGGAPAGAADRNRLRALILLLWEVGLSLTEAVQLTFTRVREGCYLDGAWSDSLSTVVAALAQCTASASGHIFGEPRGNALGTWRRRLNDLGKRAGIPNVAARLDQPRLEARADLRNSLLNLTRAVAAKSDSQHENTQTDSSAHAEPIDISTERFPAYKRPLVSRSVRRG